MALDDLQLRGLKEAGLEGLSKADRRLLDQFDYPETAGERFERLQLALSAAERVTTLLETMSQKTYQRFPELKA